MLTSPSLGLIRSPRAHFREAARQPGLRHGVAAVATTAMVATVINVVAALLEPAAARTGALVGSAAIPLLYTGFWLGSGFLVAIGARAMGCGGGRRELLSATAAAFPALLSYPLITLAQVVANRAGYSGIDDALGYLALPALAWFMALQITAIMAVHDLGFLSAFSLALLPYAAITLMLLLIILLISGLHVVGAV